MGNISFFLKRLFSLKTSRETAFTKKSTDVNSADYLSEKKDEPTSIPPFDEKAVWTRIDKSIQLHDKKSKRPSHWRYTNPIAACILAIILCGTIFYNYISPHVLVKQASWVHISTKNGEIKKVILPDSSVIWLNNESTLSYSNDFGQENRAVQLQGEAYFEVFRNETHPFIVQANLLTTKVLGTKFNIRAYKTDKEMSVSVVSGKVQVSNNTSTAVAFSEILQRSDRVVYNQNTATLTRDKLLDVSKSIYWMNSKLYFENIYLIDLTNTLQRHFNVVIKLDPKLHKQRIYADFEQKSVDTVMEILSVLISAKLHKERGHYEFIAE